MGSRKCGRAHRARRPALAKDVGDERRRQGTDFKREQDSSPFGTSGEPTDGPGQRSRLRRRHHDARAGSDHVALARSRDEHLAMRREARRGLDGGRRRGPGQRHAEHESREEAMADPRLASRMPSEKSVRVRMRTSVLTLVVVAPRPETLGACPGGDQRAPPAPPVARDRRLAGRFRRPVAHGRAHLRRVQAQRPRRRRDVHRADPDQDRRRAVAAPCRAS